MSGTLYDLKPRFQALLRPGVARLAAAGVTANQVTIATLAVSVAAGGFVAWRADERWPFLLLPVWLFLRMAMNAVDGMLAREHGQRSALGAYLNELCDVLADTALTVPFALVAPFGWAGVGSVVVLAIVSEMAGALGPMVGAPRRYDGPMGKSDRAFFVGAIALWAAIAPIPEAASLLMPLLTLLTAWTVANRVRRALAEAAA